MRNKHPAEWLKWRNSKPSATGDDVQQLEFSYVTDGRLKWYNCFEILIDLFKPNYMYM